LVEQQEGHPAGVGSDDITAALHVLQLQLSPLTTSIILSSNEIQNGDPGCIIIISVVPDGIITHKTETKIC